MILDASVGQPAIDLGCGTFCTFNYNSLISSALAVVVTLASRSGSDHSSAMVSPARFRLFSSSATTCFVA